MTEELTRALRPLATLLAPLLAPLVAKELRGQVDEQKDPWIDQEHSPLGRRNHCRVCKTGQVKGARKLGKKWLVRKSALDAYVQAKGLTPPAPPPVVETEEEEFVRALAEYEEGFAKKRRKTLISGL